MLAVLNTSSPTGFLPVFSVFTPTCSSQSWRDPLLLQARTRRSRIKREQQPGHNRARTGSVRLCHITAPDRHSLLPLMFWAVKWGLTARNDADIHITWRLLVATRAGHQPQHCVQRAAAGLAIPGKVGKARWARCQKSSAAEEQQPLQRKGDGEIRNRDRRRGRLKVQRATSNTWMEKQK